MPYIYAKYYIGFVFIVILVGFWESYFISIVDVPNAFHVHAFTALAWVALLMFQDWTIRSKRRNLHRIGGITSLFLFPFLILGFTMIINHSAAGYVANKSQFSQFLAPSFGLSMFFAILAYLILYYLALVNRRNVRLHAGYMLTTPLVLFESPFSRILLSHLPFFVFTNSVFPQRILDAIVISMGVAIIFSFVMYLRDRKAGAPFIIAAGLMSLQAVSMYMGTKLEWVREGFAAYASIPNELTMIISFLIAACVAWLGWKAGKRPVSPNMQR